MLNYNTQLEQLKLPEYGRYVQEMVNHCLTIEDHQSRNLCARTIVDSICNLNPSMANNEDFRKKLWDQIAILSDFKLDIDYPYEVIQAESLQTKPEPMVIPANEIRYRHYGKYIVDMIDKAVTLDEGDERKHLEYLIASQMKKTMLAVTAEGVEDERIFKDLYDMSRGRIKLSTEDTKLHEFQEAPVQKTGKKKRKK